MVNIPYRWIGKTKKVTGFMNIHELQRYLSQKGCRLRGCSELDISKIEKYFKVELPVVYKEFLRYMGRGADSFMKGSSAFYNEIFDLRDDLDSMLSEIGKTLPDNAFVFWAHQGYQFAFFYVDGGDNPPVYFYYEGDFIR